MGFKLRQLELFAQDFEIIGVRLIAAAVEIGTPGLFISPGKTHGVNRRVRQHTAKSIACRLVQKMHVNTDIMTHQQGVAAKLDKFRQHLFYRRSSPQFFRRDPVHQGGLVRVKISGPDIAMKGLAELNLQVNDSNRTNGNNFILSFVQPGEFGIKDYKRVLVQRLALAEISKQFFIVDQCRV